jgi:tRNA uridine 5-carboxymethylaminomethyl modification enzyme
VLAAAGEPPPAHAVRVAELARRPGVPLRALLEAAGVADVDAEAAVTAELELKYAGYLARERQAAARLARMQEFALPEDLPYPTLHALSFEARQKLDALRPRTLAQAGRVPGVSPSDLQNLMVEVERRRRGSPTAGGDRPSEQT